MSMTSFKRGDVVVHLRRPEWGDGVIDAVSQIVHQGEPAQRVVVKFAHQGRMALNTAIAQLQAKAASAPPPSARPLVALAPASIAVEPVQSAPDPGRGWLGKLGDQPDDSADLSQLPSAATDPLSSLSSRLQATLDTYRFGSQRPASAKALVEWAIAQTGVHDPVSQYGRHEMEQAYGWFAHRREQHLQDLVRTAIKQGKSYVIEEFKRAPLESAAKDALQRAIRSW